MREIVQLNDSILCSLGSNTKEVFEALASGKNGFSNHSLSTGENYPVSALTNEQNEDLKQTIAASFSRFEQMCIKVILEATNPLQLDLKNSECLFILASTKGNIGFLQNVELKQGINLELSAQKIGAYFGNPNKVKVVSIACISGVAAQVVAKRVLESGFYKNVVIVACDELSDFVLAGFHSFKALSLNNCKPFDKNRDGLNLGEAAACLVLGVNDDGKENQFTLAGGAITNDANHLSGPSKTGMELAEAINQALEEASISASEIEFALAHGTATNYNDEMEAKALNLAHINAPVTSLKGYFGHTLGASGLIETIIGLRAMKENILIPTLGFQESNVTVPINVVQQQNQTNLTKFVKTAAGFGGCNAAIIWTKNDKK